MTTRLLIGDVFDRMAELEDHSFDLIITSPPFLALRSYLPDGHPDKAKEIGSEATPAEYLDVLLALTAEWRRLLAPHGSIAVEIGDTYAGSGGAGGDYDEDGWRDGQTRFDGSASRAYGTGGRPRPARNGTRPGWPLEKSLCGIPTLYTWSLAYGRNLLTGQPSPAGQWRIRNLKPWIRSNPPVGALGDKERPATSYITVACTGRDRWFDLDAVRTGPSDWEQRYAGGYGHRGEHRPNGSRADGGVSAGAKGYSPAGAPPLDWWHHVDAIIDHEIDQRAGQRAHARTAKGVDRQPRTGKSAERGGDWHRLDEFRETNGAVGARGVHIRRALERAGILTILDAHDISPRGYTGAHYAVWPPELVKQLIDEMCPRRVCVVCGEPSRRLTEATVDYAKHLGSSWADRDVARPKASGTDRNSHSGQPEGDHITSAQRRTVGWSDCGHGNWRPGRILDPFVGSGTTLAVASGMARDSIGIDIDERSADLAHERCGMFLEIDYPTREETA